MKYTRFITHSGALHPDEVLGAALLVLKGVIPSPEDVERLNREDITDSMTLDPSTLLFDIGGEYTPELANFDHHQDTHLPATNMLLLDYFEEDKQLASKLKDGLFKQVSDLDTGKIKNPGNGFYSRLITNFNSYEGGDQFTTAVHVSIPILKALIDSYLRVDRDKDRWMNLPRILDGKVVLNTTPESIVSWGNYAKNEGVIFLIGPLKEYPGQYALVKRADLTNLQIPKISEDLQPYRHAAGFMARYSNQDEAIKHAEEIIKSL